ncbi:MAG: type II CAAX prenyl endopeptidase Rce1 family protein [Nitrososphaerota archaeon]
MTTTPGNTPPAYQSYPPSEAAPPGDLERYGQVGKPPWTFAQTMRGAVATLAPWLVFIIGSQLLTAQSGTSGQRHLSTVEDIIGGVFAFLVTGVVELAFVIAPVYYAVLRRAPGITLRQGLAALGLRRTPLRPAIFATIVGFVVIIMSSVLYSYLIQVFNLPLRTNSDTLLQQAKYAPISTLALVAGAVFIAPICEEIFFRGFLFSGLLHRMSLWPAALLAAFLFALAHGDVGSFAVLFVIGLVLAFVRWRVGSIWPGIIIHAANNATAAIAIILALTAR